MSKPVLVMLLAVAMAAPIWAADDPAASGQAGSQPPTAAENSSGPDTVVCKNFPPPTGSRIGGRRICHTEREWEQLQFEAQQALKRFQGAGAVSTPNAGGN